MKIYTKKQLADKMHFNLKTKADRDKLDCAYNLYITALKNGDSGAFGKATEILTRRSTSTKTTVASNGKPDTFITVDGHRRHCESKTNGGRIDEIHGTYIVYTLDVHRSNADKYITPRVVSVDTFLSMLITNGWTCFIKNKKSGDGMGIDITKRGFWRWLESLPEYDRNREYSSSEIL